MGIMTVVNAIRKNILKSFIILSPVLRSTTKNLNKHIAIRRHTFFVTTGLAFLWPIKKETKEPVLPNNTNENSVETDIKTADELFDSGKYDECYDVLRNIEDKDNIEVTWRLCRAMYNMSKDSKYDNDKKKDLVLEAYQILSEKLEANGNHFAVHKWFAILLDTKSNYDGMKERIKQLQNVKNHMDLAVSLNPNDATTLHMLGEWCYQISELPWHHRKIAEALFASPPYSTYEEALEYFLKAESIQPRFYSLNLLRLGNCYLKLKKEDQAKYYLQLAAKYPAKSNDDHLANTQAAELLKKFS